MVKKIFLLFLVMILFSSCLSDKRMKIEILNNNNELEINSNKKEYKVGEVIEIYLEAKEDCNYIKFDLEFEIEKMELFYIEKKEFSEKNIVLSIENEKKNTFIFFDEEKSLKKNQNFATIGILVKDAGIEKININEIIKE